MVQAAAEGVVDFSQTQFEEPRWDWRLAKLLRYLDLRNRRELLTLKLNEYTAQLQRRLTYDQRELLLNLIIDTQQKIEKTYQPSAKEGVSQATAATKIVDGTKLWEAEYGSLNDPVMQARINSVAAALTNVARHTARQVSKLPPSVQAELASQHRR